MIFFAAILAMMIGACVGSFCNVLVVRLHEGTSIGGRSRCVSCRKTIPASQLIPVLSWIQLRARCAFCRASIHWQYPAVEAAGACIGLAAFFLTSGPWDLMRLVDAAFILIFLSGLLVLTATDLRWGTVPVEFAAGLAVFLGVWRACSAVASGDTSLILPTIIAMGVTWAVLAGLVAITRGRMMGEGDPSVGFLIGAGVGWPLAPVALVIAFMLGGACAIALLLTGRVSRKDTVPFVPFLAAGAVATLIWQAPLLTFLYETFY
jgi:leader peptidase (prepilin peptidase) / N-methyltransferase